MNKKNFLKKQTGLTIIELLVVIALVAFLATVGMVAFTKSRAKARDVVRKADLKSLFNALELYFAVNKRYPVYNSALISNGTNSWFTDISGQMPRQPLDPKESSNYHYYYKSNDQGSEFEINVRLEYDISLAENDGGNNSNYYELGTNLLLLSETNPPQ